MNGIFIIDWIKDETKEMPYDRKREFIQDRLRELNKYAVDYELEHTIVDESED